jgi:hypothetical protein
MATGTQSELGKSPEREKSKQDESIFGWKHVLPIVLSSFALIISIRQSFIANDAAKIANEAATVTAYDRGVNPVLELDKAYLANSDLRPFFYENKHLDDKAPARARGLALAEMSLDCYENILTQVTEHPTRFPEQQREADVAWITQMFKNSEVLRDYLHSHRSWYSKTLLELAP